MKKLSQKEREELVTKGFLEDCFDIRFEELSKKLTKEITTEISADFRQHLDSLMEHQMHQLEVLMEQMDDRYVLRREWESARS